MNIAAQITLTPGTVIRRLMFCAERVVGDRSSPRTSSRAGCSPVAPPRNTLTGGTVIA